MLLIGLQSQAQLITIGTGTVAQGTSGQSPYSTTWEDAKIQYLVLKSELNGLGITAGNFTTLAFNSTTIPTPPLTGYTIKIGHTPLGSLTGYATPVWTVCWVAPTPFTPVIGWNTFTFTTPFLYNDVDNIVIEVCHDNASWTGGGTVNATTTTFQSVYGTYMDGGAGCGVGSLTNISQGSNRPNMQINFVLAGSGPATVPPIASFAYSKNPMDTVWIGNPRTMVNTSSGADKSYWDILGFNAVTKNGPYAAVPEVRTPKTSQGINDVFIDTINNAVNFKYTFPDRGFYRLKVTSVNKFGSDTYIDTIYVDTPSMAPTADFFADKRVVGVYDFATMFDLTTNGPISWFWYLKPGYYNPLAPFFNSFSPSAGAQNPIINANEGGLFDVCLVASNYRGTDTMCKPGYVKIISGYEVCKGSSTAKDTISRENEGSAKLYTVGGTYVPNLIGTCLKGFTIASCSDTATLYIDRFRMRANVTTGVSDSLLIRLGSATGTVLARMGGTVVPAAFRTIKVPGGIAYLQTIIANPSSGTPPGDSGYVVRWDAPPASYGTPNASFNMPDTIYDGYTVQFINTTTGKNASYAWDTNGDNVFGVDNPTSGIDSTSKNPTRMFSVFAPYTANICLKAFNCVGSDTFCKTIQFLPVAATPSANFTVNRTSGFTTDTFRFTDLSQNGPNQWLWTFVPNNVAYLSGTSNTSQHPILLLNSATNYDVTLTATNQQGSNTITKFSYTSAIAFGNPGCSGCPISGGQPYLPGSLDLGITRVTLADMDTTTALNTPIYHALFSVKSANLYRGVTYTLATARPTANDPMSTRGWIDFNRNTNFGDEAIETIISENNQFKAVTTGTFTVPGNAPIGNTRLRVGVTYGNTSITDKVATLGCFEEYGINIAVDLNKPTIALKGSSLEKVEVNKPYIEKGVIAIDNLEGDISSRYQVFGFVNTTKVGYYVLKYIAADLYGNNSDTITRTVQVEINQTGPSLTLIGSDSIAIEVFNSYVELGATAMSNTGSNITSQIIRSGVVDTSALGTYLVSYSITDQFGFNTTKQRKVVVMDTTKPTIVTNAGTISISHQVGTPYMDPITVMDNYWKGITPVRTGVINPSIPGSYSLIYNAVDGSGNIAPTFYVTVVVKDLVPPTITLEGPNPLTVDVYTSFNDPGVTTNDNYYPNVTTVRTGLPTMNLLGDYLVTYTATDGAGNTATVTRLVKVVDRIAPEIELLGSNPFEVCRFKAFNEPGVKIRDNYYADSVLQGELNIDLSKVDVSRPGYYFAVYSVTDPSGNKAVSVQRLINVIENGICATGIKELSTNNNLSIYPNPNKGMFTIANKTTTSITSVQVMDVVGKTVYSKTTDSNEVNVDLTSMNKGLYMVLIKDANGNEFSSKVVVE
ncbi:MAG: immunoglobulin-like domain-containing protein [Bacteroidota bacterium]